MIEIKPFKITNGEVTVPGSKSYTHRLLIAASLSDGICLLKNPLKSEDTCYTIDGLKSMGVSIEQTGDLVIVNGEKGDLKSCNKPIFLGNSGTSMRLLTGVAAIGKGRYELTGTKRMHERPVKDLLDALNALGVDAYSINNDGCPPVIVYGGGLKGGSVKIRCNVSSQYLSSLLLIAPCIEKGMEIEICDGLVSKPYVDMTVDIMTKMGIRLNRSEYESFHVVGRQIYKSGEYFVEPDCSQACYFWAAAAISGAKVKVKNISRNTSQGDLRFTEILEKMGCKIDFEHDGVSITGGKLYAVEADMADMPDIVPTLSVVAAFAHGTTVIKNVAHLKAKETDRLNATANELKKIGIEAFAKDDGLIIKGGKPHGAQIDTYNDHRMAMSFALLGLRIPGVSIKDEKCVEKSFPNFWDVFFKL
jgi:3-phosphoshikimate 1-carboxyvinyltransferase